MGGVMGIHNLYLLVNKDSEVVALPEPPAEPDSIDEEHIVRGTD